MNDDYEHHTDDDLSNVLAGLNQFAERLNAQRFPGRAWMAPIRRTAIRNRGRQALRRWAGPLMAAAAVVIVAASIRFLETPRPRVASHPLVRTMPTATSPTVFAPGDTMAEQIELSQGPLDERAFASEPFVSYPFQGNSAEGMAEIVIVEDFDSYSIIDMSTGSPLISFVHKDSLDLTDMTSVFSAPVEAIDDQI